MGDSNETKGHLGKMVIQAREERGWSQQELADYVELDVRTVKQVEGGKGNPYLDTLMPLVRLLGISMDICFSEEAIEDKLRMDRLSRELLKLTPSQYQKVVESASQIRQYREKNPDEFEGLL